MKWGRRTGARVFSRYQPASLCSPVAASRAICASNYSTENDTLPARAIPVDTQLTPLLHTQRRTPHMASGCRECLAPADRSLVPGRSHDLEMQPRAAGQWGIGADKTDDCACVTQRRRRPGVGRKEKQEQPITWRSLAKVPPVSCLLLDSVTVSRSVSGEPSAMFNSRYSSLLDE